MTPLEEEAAAVAERRRSLHAALVAALTDLTVVDKGRTANAGSYSYDYADLADVVALTRPALAAHGIVVLTPIHDHANGLVCTVKLIHTSGECMDLGPFPFPQGRDAEATGSVVTYTRRYALMAALGIAAGDDDDDGASAKPAPPPWTMASAKNRVLAAVGGKADLAKQAWIDLGYEERWQSFEHDFPASEVEAWVNQPAAGGALPEEGGTDELRSVP